MTHQGCADESTRERGPVEVNQALPITSSEIHLWLVFFGDVSDERLLTAYRDMLSPAEQEQEGRYHFERDRRRYLITRALVRTVLSRYVSINPKEWDFLPNAYGRPEIVNEQAQHSGLCFNLSHTPSLIVLGVTTGRALGVDVENVRIREAPLEIVDRYFTPPEAVALMALPPDQRSYRFFELWTFKESYIKARGMGLSLPLDQFSFCCADERQVDLLIDPGLCDDAARWEFLQFAPAPDYLVAVCAQRTTAERSSIVVRQTVPTISEQRLAVEFLRASPSRVLN
jgi:4'-phosphopantetheinyl transferase